MRVVPTSRAGATVAVLALCWAMLMSPRIATCSEAAAATFAGPFGVATDAAGRIYVAEINGKRVSVLDPTGRKTGEITDVPGYGPLQGPFDVAVAPDGGLLVADTRGHRILALAADHTLRFVLGGEKSAAPGHFSEPHFVTTDGAGSIYVADTFNARIQKFTPGGEFVATWGKVGTGVGEFALNGYVGGIACDDAGHIYVRESENGRVQKFTTDGRHVATIAVAPGSAPDAHGSLGEGYGLVWHDDSLWTVNTFSNRVQRWSGDGELLSEYAPGQGNGGAHLNHPVDLAATPEGDLIISDWKNDRVVRLAPELRFVEAWGGSMEAYLDWQPPARVERAPGSVVRFSVYASLAEADLTASADAGVTTIYNSIGSNPGPWNLEAAVAAAHAHGLRVEPSVAMYFMGQGTDFAASRPDLHIWKRGAAAPLDGLLAWSEPEVRSYRAEAMAREVAASGVDGLMLDYIRYLGNDLDVSEEVIEAYRIETGRDARALRDDDADWLRFRAGFVTDFIVELRRELARLDRAVEVSVFINPDPAAALGASMQDWVTWVRMGIVDKVNVGVYTRDMQQMYDAVRRVRELSPRRTNVNAFIACYGGNLNTPELLKKGADAVVAAGADEVTIYRSDVVWELDLWPAIGEAVAAANGGGAESRAARGGL